MSRDYARSYSTPPPRTSRRPKTTLFFLLYQLLRQWYRFTHQSLLDRAASDELTKSLFRADRGNLLAIGRAEWLVDQSVLFADFTLFLKGMGMLKDINANLYSLCHLPSKDVYTTVFTFRWLRVARRANADFDIDDIDDMVKTCAVSFALQKCLHAHPFVHLRFGVAFHLRSLGNDLDTMWRASKYNREEVSDLIEFIRWLDSHRKGIGGGLFFLHQIPDICPARRLFAGGVCNGQNVQSGHDGMRIGHNPRSGSQKQSLKQSYIGKSAIRSLPPETFRNYESPRSTGDLYGIRC